MYRHRQHQTAMARMPERNHPRRKHTAEERKVIRAIQKLDRAGEPLNITAVKRNHAELMEDAFAVRPFWGWKQAIEDAGLSYSTIRIHLEPYVQCRICGEYFRVLGWHFRSVHATCAEEYRMDHPDAPVCSEEHLAARILLRTRISRTGIPHWEPLWSGEYTLDRIRCLYGAGHPVNHGAISRIEGSLSGAARRHFGSWNRALESAGLAPSEIRLRRDGLFPDAAAVIAEIRRRKEKQQPLNANAILNGAQKDDALYNAAKRHYGSWRDTLKAAGLDPDRYVKARTNVYPNADAVIAAIGQRMKENMPLNGLALQKGPDADCALHNSAVRYLGCWRNALRSAGLDPEAIRIKAPCRYPDAVALVAEIKRRARNGLPLNTTSLLAGQHVDFALHKSAQRYFGSWPEALEAAGIDPRSVQKIRYNVYPGAVAVISEIKRRHKCGAPLNANAVRSGVCGDRALYESSLRYWGSWPGALEAAGFDPEAIRPKRSRRYSSAAEVIEGIARRQKMALPLNAASLCRGQHAEAVLYIAGQRYFGSWRDALKAAGLDPDEVGSLRVSSLRVRPGNRK